MSMPDITDDFLLGDDDELDYDLEKDEEDALLADDDHYDEEIQDANNHIEARHEETQEDTEDILDIDANVALDETEDFETSISNICIKQESVTSNSIKQEIDDYSSDTEIVERERNRFTTERNVIQRPINSNIPDSLDKVPVNTNPKNNYNNSNNNGNNNNGNRNGRSWGNNRGRGRGRGNHNRGNVFNRVGNPQQQQQQQQQQQPPPVPQQQLQKQQPLQHQPQHQMQHQPLHQPLMHSQHQPQHQTQLQTQHQPQHQPQQQTQLQHQTQPQHQAQHQAQHQPQHQLHQQQPQHQTQHQPQHQPQHQLQSQHETQHQPLHQLPLPPLAEGKTVLINPHFRGNVQVSSDVPVKKRNRNRQKGSCFTARLVWDANVARNQQYQHRFPPPAVQQSQNQQYPNQFPQQVWSNPPYENYSQANYQEPPPTPNYAGPNDTSRTGYQNNVPQYNQTQQGNFRGREVRYIPNQPPPLITPQQTQNFSQQPPNNFQRNPNYNYDNRNQVKPFINQPPPNQPIVQQMQQNFSPQNVPPQSYVQSFTNPNQYIPNQDQTQFPNQTYNQYETFENQNQYITQPNNQFQGPPSLFNNSGGYNQNFGGQNSFDVHYDQNNDNQYNNRQFHNESGRGGQDLRAKRLPQQNFNNVKRSPPKRRGFDNSQVVGDMPKKKRRSMELANLHEVPTVDMPDSTFIEDKIPEYEDEETKAYRKKIEEQKKLREKILQQKEERRKQAAAQKNSNLIDVQATTSEKELKEIIKEATLVSSNQLEPIPPENNVVAKQQINKQAGPRFIKQEPGVAVRQVPQQGLAVQQPIAVQQGMTNQIPKIINQQGMNPQNMNVPRPGMIRPVNPAVLRGVHQNNPRFNGPRPQQLQNKQLPAQQMKKGAQRMQVVRQNAQNQQNVIQIQQALQKQPVQQRIISQNPTTPKILITQQNELANQTQRRIVLKTNTQSPQKQPVNRRIVLKSANTEVPQVPEVKQDENIVSFLTNRMVVEHTTIATTNAGGMELVQGVLIKTPVVTVSNLAAGTTDVKIRKLCQGLGPVQKIQMIPNSRQATIQFKNVVSAHKFFKKFQRKIIDLSMIQVSLVPVS